MVLVLLLLFVKHSYIIFFGGSNFEAQIFVSWVLNFVKSEMWVRAFCCNSVL